MPDRAAGTARARGTGSRAAHGRAGRDLPVAIAVGVGIAAVVVASVLTVRWLFVAFVAVVAALGTHELVAALRLRGVTVPAPPLVVGAGLVLAATWRWGAGGLAAAAVLTAVVTVAWRLAARRPHRGRDALVGVALTAYVPALAGCVGLLAVPADGARRVLTFAVVTVCTDVGAYATGVLFGRHRLAPRISPNKTWEGFAG